MNSLNSIILEGNLTRDPEAKVTPKGTNVTNFSLASNRYFRNSETPQKEVSFFDIECWGVLAERCARDLSKGKAVRVVGRLKQDRWTDADGKPRSHIRIVADHVDITKRETESEEGAEEAKKLATVGEPELVYADSSI